MDLILANAFKTNAHVNAGMTMSSANGIPLSVWDDFNVIVQNSAGAPILTTWENDNGITEASLKVSPEFQILRPTGIPQTAPQNYEHGICGLVPLVRVSSILDSSPNLETIQRDDVLLSIGDKQFPRMGQLRNYLSMQPNGTLDAKVLRNSEVIELSMTVSGGKIGAMLVNAWETPIFAMPLPTELNLTDGELIVEETPIALSNLKGGERFQSVNGTPALDWIALRDLITKSESSVDILCATLSGDTVQTSFEVNKEDK